MPGRKNEAEIISDSQINVENDTVITNHCVAVAFRGIFYNLLARKNSCFQ